MPQGSFQVQADIIKKRPFKTIFKDQCISISIEFFCIIFMLSYLRYISLTESKFKFSIVKFNSQLIFFCLYS